MPAISHTASVRSVLMVVYRQVRLLDVAGPLQVFAFANELGANYELRLGSLGGRSVATTVGVSLPAEVALETFAEPIDTLLVPGGPGALEAADCAELISAVRRLAGGVRQAASVCTGAFVLAAAELLDGRRATTRWAPAPAFRPTPISGSPGYAPATTRPACSGPTTRSHRATTNADFRVRGLSGRGLLG